MTEATLAYDDVVERYDPVLGLEVHVELEDGTLFRSRLPELEGATR